MEHIKNQLQNLAIKCKAEFNLDVSDSQDYIECSLKKDDIEIYVDIPLHGSTFTAYDMSSNFLPRELYNNEVQNNYTEAQRSSEILDNIELILNKKLKFYSKPNIFNKLRGYIILPIDGKQQKIFLKNNYYNFPKA